MKKMNNKGFSLIELIIVIAIMAVLVAIIAPNLTKYLGRSKQETDKKNLDEIKKQVKNVISEAAIDDVQVVSGAASTSTTAYYYIKQTGTGAAPAITVTAVSHGTNDFAAKLQNVLDPDTATKSKVDNSKQGIWVTVTGSESAGFTVRAQFS